MASPTPLSTISASYLSAVSDARRWPATAGAAGSCGFAAGAGAALGWAMAAASAASSAASPPAPGAAVGAAAAAALLSALRGGTNALALIPVRRWAVVRAANERAAKVTAKREG